MAIKSHIHIIFTLIDVCKGKNRPYIQTSTSVGNMENSRVTMWKLCRLIITKMF